MADGLSGSLIIAAAVVMSISTLMIALRLWVRASMKVLGGDDYFIAAAWMFLMAFEVVVVLCTQVGFGKHKDDVSTQDHEKFSMFITACSSTFSVGVGLAKISFALLYIRIQPGRVLQVMNKVLIVFLACQAIEEVCVVVFQCKPVIASWREDIEGDCLDLRVLWWTTFVFNMSTDLFLFIQPIPAMWKLQLPVAKRIGLVAMLSLGLLVCIISIIRIVNVQRIGLDDTFDLAEPMIWSGVELCSLVVCSCIPSLRQVAARIPGLNSALGLSSHKTSQNPYGRSNTRKTGSIPLQSYNYSHREYAQARSANKSTHGGGQYGMTSRAIGGAMDSNNDSQEEIFPHKTDGAGAIMVTHEVVRDVESTASSVDGVEKVGQAGADRQV